MTFKLLWNFKAQYSYPVSLLLSLVVLIIVGNLDARPQSIASLLVIVAGILTFVFLTELPTGTKQRRFVFELLHLVASCLLFVLEFVIFLAIVPQHQQYLNSNLVLTFMGISLFSHLAVRIFARPAAQWEKMRRRRLLWEITHAQLRLVLVTMFIMFMLLIIVNLWNVYGSGLSASEYISNLVTFLIAIGGFFGVITGILLVIVLVPASLLSYFAARRITQRLSDLIDVTHTVSEKQIHTQVTVEGEDEIAQLQRDFNTMMDSLMQSRQDLEAERDAVRQLLQSRQQLVADVSHELRTPVATIRSYLETLTPAPENQADMTIIEREVLHLQRLIDDVFTLARADVQQIRYDIQSIEISHILDHTVSVVKAQAWQSKKIDVLLDYQPQIPLVLADEKRLEQILSNLLRNAIRHTAPGGLIRVIANAQPTWVTIAVQDTGEGIAEGDLPYIWERFYRTADSRATHVDGSGLGLALVKEMVEAMSGTVTVSSLLGQGSCFEVALPRLP